MHACFAQKAGCKAWWFGCFLRWDVSFGMDDDTLCRMLASIAPRPLRKHGDVMVRDEISNSVASVNVGMS